jgi:hypothetical protein
MPPRAGLSSHTPGRHCEQAFQQLVWVLISILILLELATSYLYWAKIESAWPVFR